METISNPKKDSELYKKGQKLINAAYEYWQEYQKQNTSCAVVWLKDSSGHMVLFTRGEYKDSLMSVVDTLQDQEAMECVFEEP